MQITDYTHQQLSALQRLLMLNDLINIPNSHAEIIADKRKRLLDLDIPSEHVDYLCKPRNTASEPIIRQKGEQAEKWASFEEFMAEMYA